MTVTVCARCRGEGEVHFNPSRSFPQDPQLEDTAKCPDCNGGGTIHRREAYRLFVSPAQTELVRIWDDGTVEVCTREEQWTIWGPPIVLVEEKMA